jgi:UDP-2,3-diacylglucosamine pyrophosphatase LpxH
MSVIVVHLSDIHIKSEKDKILNKADKISSKIMKYQHECDTCIIVVSGDVAFSGKRDQYMLAEIFLLDIKSQLEAGYNNGVWFVVTPGNHDCDFSQSSQVREIIINSMEKETPCSIEDSVLQQCTDIQDEFFSFRDRLSPDTESSKGNRLWYRYDFGIDGKSISFDCLNFSWSSRLNEKQGGLIFPIEQYEENFSNKSDLSFYVFHHPLNWIKQGQYQNLRSKIRANSDVVLCGHEHHGSVTKIDDTENGDSVIIEGCCLQESDSKDISQFHILKLDLDSGEFENKILTYEGDEYNETHSNISTSIFRSTPRKTRNNISIDNSFMKWLVNPGANYIHPYKQSIELNDIFVYPDLERKDVVDDASTNYSSKILVENVDSYTRVLIRGEESYGKTALLKSVYTSLFDKGYLPVYLDALKISRAEDKSLMKVFSNAIEEQYGKDSLDNFLSSDNDKKILLIDNIDGMKVSDRYQHKVISYYKNISKKTIVTSNNSTDFGEILSPELAHELSDFAHYNIRQFGNKLRYEFIKKWRSIGVDYNLSAADLIARVDESEKILNSVIGKNLVPKTPLYMLTILQSLEGGNSGSDFHNGGLGYYYQYLITEALGVAKVKASELDEVFNYIGQLAWFIYNQESTELEENTIIEFTKIYSKEYFSIDPAARISLLEKSNLLYKRGRFYSFSYPYIYYYFLGKYFSENISKEVEVQNIISNCCNHIYIHENSNIVMFLTHHTKDKGIITTILDNLEELFGDRDPITFDGDTDHLNVFIDKTTTLIYENTDPDKVRQKRSELQDQIEDKDEQRGIEKEKECTDDLDLISKLNKLVKTTEILGQILKSYYGSIKNSEKKELIRQIFNAQLRALKDFYTFLEGNGDGLEDEVLRLLESQHGNLDEEKRRALAKRFCYQLIGSVSTAFILRPASAVSSIELRSVISDTAQENPTTAFKLIKIAVDLELPDELNFEEIKSVYQSVKSDMFCQRILQTLVLKHLYLFKLSEHDKQRICGYIDIPIKHQAKIDFRNRGLKLG